MTLEEILQLKEFNLPYQISLSGKLSPGNLIKVLEDYNDAIVSSTDLFDGIFKSYYSSITPSKNIDLSIFKNDITTITKGIKDVIDLYLNGSPAAAYSKFDETIFKGNIKYLFERRKVIARDSSFYRLRTDKLDDPPTPHQLFHVPFELRFRIDTKRYSIPGFPCLYAADSLHIACKELDVDDASKYLKDVKVVRLTNNSTLRYLDVAARDVSAILSGKTSFLMTVDDSIIREVFEYALMFPIIAACHSKIDYERNWAPFKIEYIVPQLMLQWFRDNNKFCDGIRYFSNRIDYDYFKKFGAVYNFVFPVKASNHQGFCNHLTNLFNSTDVVLADHYPHAKTALDEKIEELQDKLKTMTSDLL